MKYLLHILLGLNLLVTTLVYVNTDQRMGDIEWSIEKVKNVELALMDLKLDQHEEKIYDIDRTVGSIDSKSDTDFALINGRLFNIEVSTDEIKDKLGIY